MGLSEAIKAVKWAQKRQADIFIVNTSEEEKMFKKAAQILGLTMTIRLPRGGPCLVCYENHKDFERDCHPPTDMSSVSPKIVSLKSA